MASSASLVRGAFCAIAFCASALAACHMLFSYAPQIDGAIGARDGRGDGAQDGGHEGGLVLIDGRPTDADGDARVTIPDAGAACVRDVKLWAGTCRRAAHPNSCAIGCGVYTVVCVGSSCTCAITDGDSHVCSGITASEASCEPASACFEAVSAGCCAWP